MTSKAFLLTHCINPLSHSWDEVRATTNYEEERFDVAQGSGDSAGPEAEKRGGREEPTEAAPRMAVRKQREQGGAGPSTHPSWSCSETTSNWTPPLSH